MNQKNPLHAAQEVLDKQQFKKATDTRSTDHSSKQYQGAPLVQSGGGVKSGNFPCPTLYTSALACLINRLTEAEAVRL